MLLSFFESVGFGILKFIYTRVIASGLSAQKKGRCLVPDRIFAEHSV